jgi:hypothetical protein
MQAARDATCCRHRGERIQAEGAATVDNEMARLPSESPRGRCDSGVWHGQEDEVASGGDPRGVGGEFHIAAKPCRQGLSSGEVRARDRSHAVAGLYQPGGERGREASRANESHRRDRAAWHGNKEGTSGARRQRV